MPRKISKRKAIQAAKRKAAAEAQAMKSRRWPGTRRQPSGSHPPPEFVQSVRAGALPLIGSALFGPKPERNDQ